MNVGDRIKKVLDSSDMTKVEFAEKIGVSKQTLYKYENGKIKNIPSEVILKIAKLGGISPAELMGWVSSEPDGKSDYYIDTTERISQLLSDSGYIVHYENYSFETLVIIEKPDEKQVFAVYEGDLLSRYEQLRIDNEDVDINELVERTVANTTFLAEDEEQLLANYRKLNNLGKNKAREDVEDLTMLPKYTEEESGELNA